MENNNSQHSKKVDSSRRKLLDGLVKAAPVLTSMSVLPVWATNHSMSGNLSGNTSAQQSTTSFTFDGCSHGFYKQKANLVITGNENGKKHTLSPGIYRNPQSRVKHPAFPDSTPFVTNDDGTRCKTFGEMCSEGMVSRSEACYPSTSLGAQHFDPYTITFEDIFGSGSIDSISRVLERSGGDLEQLFLVAWLNAKDNQYTHGSHLDSRAADLPYTMEQIIFFHSEADHRDPNVHTILTNLIHHGLSDGVTPGTC